MIKYVQQTEPASEPIVVADAKTYMRITFSDDDDLITDTLIPAARRSVERYLNRTLIERDWKAYLDCFPKNEIIKLSKGPVTDVQSVKYYTGGTLTLISASDYIVSSSVNICEISPALNKSWPTPDDRYQAIEILYTAGYGAADDVPEDIKLAILLTISHLYNNRSLVTYGANVLEVPKTGQFLLNPYRIQRL